MSVFEDERNRKIIGSAFADAIEVVFDQPERDAGLSVAKAIDLCNEKVTSGLWTGEHAESYLEAITAAEAAAVAASRTLHLMMVRRAFLNVVFSLAQVANNTIRWPIIPT